MSKKFNLLLISLFIALSAISYGQSLNGYKYAYVKKLKYKIGQDDIFGISSVIKSSLMEKGIFALTETSPIPEEVFENPCLMLHVLVDHTSNLAGDVELKIYMFDCNNEIVYTGTGSSAIGSNLAGTFQRATRKALANFKAMQYSFVPAQTPVLPEVELITETEESLKNYLSTSKLNPIEGIYKSIDSEYHSYYMFAIIRYDDVFKAVVMDSKNHWQIGEVKAIFEETSQQGLYSSIWYLSNKSPHESFATLENEAVLSIELPTVLFGETGNQKYIKIFPSAGSQASRNDNISKSTGSGFFLTSDGIIATNAHVVKGSRKIVVSVSVDDNLIDYDAKVLLSDNSNDVALVQIIDEDFKKLPPIPYGFSNYSEVGSRVFTIGFPLNEVMGSNYKVTDGIISANSGLNDDIRFYQISVPLQPGNSGGPLFNSEGNVIGITAARLNDEVLNTKSENVSYAIKSVYLLNLYNMLPESTDLSPISHQESKELKDHVKEFKSFVCIIRAF